MKTEERRKGRSKSSGTEDFVSGILDKSRPSSGYGASTTLEQEGGL